MSEAETEKELRAAIGARQELGAELEPHVIDAFVERIERRLDERAREKTPAKRESRTNEHSLALAIVSLCVSIPLVAIAGSTVGLAGVIAVCVAIVIVNVVYGD
jgi:uncharacterized membrane protein